MLLLLLLLLLLLHCCAVDQCCRLLRCVLARVFVKELASLHSYHRTHRLFVSLQCIAALDWTSV